MRLKMELRGGCMHYPKQKDTWRDDYEHSYDLSKTGQI